MKKLPIKAMGSVSWGTLKEEDVYQNIISYLRAANNSSIADKFDKLIAEIAKRTDHVWQSEDAQWLLWEMLFDTMTALAPEGYYFGAHPGAGADFGFWQEEEM